MTTLKNFADRLTSAIDDKGSAALVGLDPRFEQIPLSLTEGVEPTNPEAVAEIFARFCCEIVDVVHPFVTAVKPQAAFFEQVGPAGMQALRRVIDYARGKQLLVILDGKRNDIGSTAIAYAQAYLGRGSAWGADALTISPYLGDDSISPFLRVATEQGCGLFVLVKTSNPGGSMLQDLPTPDGKLYEVVGRFVDSLAHQTRGSCGYGAVGAVIGATYPGQLIELREALPHTLFLVPGFGAQGGTAEDVKAAFDDRGHGAIVNSSRAIIFAHQRPEYAELARQKSWQDAVEAATRDMVMQLKG